MLLGVEGMYPVYDVAGGTPHTRIVPSSSRLTELWLFFSISLVPRGINQSLGCYADVTGDRALEIDVSDACDEDARSMSPAVSWRFDRFVCRSSSSLSSMYVLIHAAGALLLSS